MARYESRRCNGCEDRRDGVGDGAGAERGVLIIRRNVQMWGNERVSYLYLY